MLRTVMQLGGAAQGLLGNHDLHLLTVGDGLRQQHKGDTLDAILQAPDRDALLDWVRHRSMALHVNGWLVVHAGVLPRWSTSRTLALAAEVEQALRGEQVIDFLSNMYGNTPAGWDDSLTGHDRLRVIVNVLTRLRFCTPQGAMEFKAKGSATAAPAGYLPWFDVPGRLTSDTPIAFGHWSTVGLDAPERPPVMRHNTLALDTGCVWGNCLTAAKLSQAPSSAPGAYELLSVDCEAMQKHSGA